MYDDEKFLQVCERYKEIHGGTPLAALTARYDQVLDRRAELASYARRSNSQDDELSQLAAELTVLEVAIADAKTAVRSQLAAERAEKIEEIRRTAMDPANREAGSDPRATGQREPGAPAYVKGKLGTRIESAAETVQRANPWRTADGGPLAGHTTYGGIGETAAGFVSRAHTAIETVSERVTPAGAELLSTLLSERRDSPGYSVRRSADEVRQGAEMIVALSNPFYESAMRHVFRNPDMFRAGMGQMIWSDDEREAVREVMGNELVRAAFAETSGAAGAYALPLQLSSQLIYVNSGVASPHRQLARHELGTSNTWNGITTQGSTANVVAEGVAVTDTTPTLGQLVITPAKIMSWIFGSWESMDDTALAEQVPGMFDESRARLEGQLFATGTGSAQPFGAVTRAGPDTTAGALTNTMIYTLLANLPPRFRNAGNVAWAGNISILNACRQILKAAGTVETIVNDNTPDGIPEMLGYDFYESSAMLSGTTGNRELLLGDWKSLIIVDRLPSVTIAEPLVMSQATALPTGQRGWANYSRVGSDTVTQGAAFGSNAFVVHVH